MYYTVHCNIKRCNITEYYIIIWWGCGEGRGLIVIIEAIRLKCEVSNCC